MDTRYWYWEANNFSITIRQIDDKVIKTMYSQVSLEVPIQNYRGRT
ncbi:hypothetical protein VCR26J2_370636 [Vibrio coralliirubri]|nr:hypothetical protein VCR1J2_200163 [Vibrio coralliirubri]CDT79009.1 hypothetical protein VCR26J2_370636 [Vibrio coralliirubri]